MIHFADGTCFYIKNIVELNKRPLVVFEKVDDNFNQNNLALIGYKTNLLFFSRQIDDFGQLWKQFQRRTDNKETLPKLKNWV